MSTLLTPSGRRDRLISDVGPDAKGSKPGSEGWAQRPEKSGTDAAGAGVCEKPGVAAAAANIASRRKLRATLMVSLPFTVKLICLSENPTPFACSLERVAATAPSAPFAKRPCTHAVFV